MLKIFGLPMLTIASWVFASPDMCLEQDSLTENISQLRDVYFSVLHRSESPNKSQFCDARTNSKDMRPTGEVEKTSNGDALGRYLLMFSGSFFGYTHYSDELKELKKIVQNYCNNNNQEKL